MPCYTSPFCIVAWFEPCHADCALLFRFSCIHSTRVLSHNEHSTGLAPVCCTSQKQSNTVKHHMPKAAFAIKIWPSSGLVSLRISTKTCSIKFAHFSSQIPSRVWYPASKYSVTGLPTLQQWNGCDTMQTQAFSHSIIATTQ